MKTLPIDEAKNQLSKYLEICRDGPVVITKNGRIRAFLLPIDEDEFAAVMLQYSPSFRKLEKGKPILSSSITKIDNRRF